MNLLGSRKGFLGAIATLIAGLFILGLLSILAYTIYDDFTERVENSTIVELNNSHVRGVIADYDRAMNLWDGIISILVLASILLVGVIAYSYTPSRIFLIAIWVYGFLLGFMGFIASYVFNTFIQNNVIAGVMSQFGYTRILLTNLHWIAIIMIVIGTILAFRKKDSLGVGL